MIANKVFAALAAAAMAAVLTVSVASAQPRDAGPGWGPGMMGPGFMMGPGMGRGFGAMCDPSYGGFSAWRIERIERTLQLTDAQKTALNALRDASTKAAESLAATCPKDLPKTSTERFAVMEKRMEAMLQAIKTVRPAFDAFHATLTDDQKTKLDSVGPRRRGWGMHGWRWRD